MTEKRKSEERWGDPMVDEEQDDIKEEEEEEDDDGPPPGFHSFAWQAETKNLSAEENNVEEAAVEEAEEGEDVDENEDIDGPPPGWSPIPQTLHPTHTSGQSCCQVLFQFSCFYLYPKC